MFAATPKFALLLAFSLLTWKERLGCVPKPHPTQDIVIDGSTITINGHELHFGQPTEEWEQALGPARFIYGISKSEWSSEPHESLSNGARWDELGILVGSSLTSDGMPIVTSIKLHYDQPKLKRLDRLDPAKRFTGRLIVHGTHVPNAGIVDDWEQRDIGACRWRRRGLLHSRGPQCRNGNVVYDYSYDFPKNGQKGDPVYVTTLRVRNEDPQFDFPDAPAPEDWKGEAWLEHRKRVLTETFGTPPPPPEVIESK